MTDFMAQPSLNLPPASRQDIISALLTDYGNSFGGDASTYKYSPVPTPKELPPTPPQKERKYSNDKVLPQGGHRSMSMRFQLRVDEPSSPTSPDGSRSSMESQPTKIVSRRLKRGSKPPSLRLTVSNGSTAIVPPTPSLPFQPAAVPSSRPKKEEKSLPPPPPEKSERRQSQQFSMENTSSAKQTLPPRKDSLQSQTSEPAVSVKRKPVPKFTSLAQLGSGPRGGKGGPLPPAPRSRKQSVADGDDQASNGRSASAVDASRPRKQSVNDSEEQASNARSLRALETSRADNRSATSSPKRSSNPAPMPPAKSPVEENMAPRIVAPVNQLPPTPDENPLPAPPPASKKPFTGMGLPSNPRAKGQQHTRGKSSTGFNFMKSSKTPGQQAPPLDTITPGPTPSPRKTEEVLQTHAASLVSPIRENDQRRPFSFEAAPPPPTTQKDDESAPAPPPAKPTSPVSPIESKIAASALPPGSTSRPPPAFVGLPSQQRPQQQPSSSPPPANPARVPLAFAGLPSRQRKQQQEDEELSTPPTIPIPRQQRPSTQPIDPAQGQEAPASPPPFTPLTKQPINRPCPPLTAKHLTCYSHHSTYVWSKNTFQPMACMVCKNNDRERKWACVWCYLRVCVACSAELMKAPGRDLKGLLEKRGIDIEIKGEGEKEAKLAMGEAQARKEEMKRHDSGAGGSVGTPAVVVWGAEEEHDFA